MLYFNMIIIVGLICFPVFSLSRGTSSTYSYSNMNVNCGSTIVLNGDKLPGVYFSFSSGNYAPNVDCTLTIKGSTTNQRIIVVIDKIDISCQGDKLIIYDGKKETNSILNPNESLQCGTRKYYVKTVSSNTVIINFISNNDRLVGGGFVLNVALNFPVATCSRADNLYRCRNTYCISNLFNCDDRNWCGDNTQLYVCR